MKKLQEYIVGLMKNLQEYAVELIKKLQEYVVGLMPKYDRLMHFFVGFLMFIFCTILFSDLISLFIVIVIGLFKELIDKYVKKTHFDLVDLIFTILSPIIMIIIN